MTAPHVPHKNTNNHAHKDNPVISIGTITIHYCIADNGEPVIRADIDSGIPLAIAYGMLE